MSDNLFRFKRYSKNAYRVDEEDLEIFWLDPQFYTPGYLALEQIGKGIDVV
jgi:hypothetical protein